MHITEVPVEITLPHQSIGVVMMQPFVELDIDHEPFKWKTAKKNQQIALIEQTLALAIGRPANQPVSFTVFPEYSVPGIEGIAAIEGILSDDAWPANTVVIGGIDGLTKAEYATLCDANGTDTSVHEENKPDVIPDEQWINCCITWAKSHQGLRRWIQPKLAPAQLENNVIALRMYRGQGVFVFRGTFDNGTESRFLTLICYDWIDANSGLWDVLTAFNDESDANKDINILFLIQYNPKPNDNLFLEHARRYFEEPNTCPRLNRAAGALLFANAAGRSDAGLVTKFGFSSLICGPSQCFDKDGCPPTFAINTERLRSVPNLKRCREALLRENGACVHSFGLRLPRWIDPNVGDRSHPIENALVHSLNGAINEPRITGGTIPAIVKWCNDYLTTVELLLQGNPQHALKAPLDLSQNETADDIRRRDNDSLGSLINLLSVAISAQESQPKNDKWTKVAERRVHNVDNWDDDDVRCLSFLVYALTILKISHSIEVAASPAHGTFRINNEVYDVAVVCGPSHDECERNARERFERKAPRHVLVVTKDLLRGFKRRKHKARIDDTGGSAPDITDPSSAWHFCDYTDLISTVDGAADQVTLITHLNEALAL
jgi:hypothetical protein